MTEILRQTLVVVVDENPDTLLLFKRELGDNPDIDLLTANTCERFLDIARDQEIGIIFISMQLQNIDGIEVAKNIKALNKECKIVLMTEETQSLDLEKAWKSGVSSLLMKPITPESLRSIFSNLLKEYKRERIAIMPLITTYEKVVDKIICLHPEGKITIPITEALAVKCNAMIKGENSGICVAMEKVTEIDFGVPKRLERLICALEERNISDKLAFVGIPNVIRGNLALDELIDRVPTFETLDQALEYFNVSHDAVNKIHAHLKVAIIGPGQVGSAVAFELARSGLVSEIALVGRREISGFGEKLDLLHCASAMPEMRKVISGTYEVAQDADILVVCAGKKVGLGEKRMSVAQENVHRLHHDILNPLRESVFEKNPHVKMIIIDNPVDIVTFSAIMYCYQEKYLKDPSKQILGTGTLVDTLRFKSFLMELSGLPAKSVEGKVLGEHGDEIVPLFSLARFAYQPIRNHPFCPNLDERVLRQELIHAASLVKNSKNGGGTRWVVAMAVRMMIDALLHKKPTRLPITAYTHEFKGFGPLCMSLPFFINNKGVCGIDSDYLSQTDLFEQKYLEKAARTIHKNIIATMRNVNNSPV